ncbi:hypothetical protein KCP73_22465 [Salmonella enterica subsp. enterica]|nr:hypothetical protein KCP73_22465 [Salmonella enterica subsp. enterica]
MIATGTVFRTLSSLWSWRRRSRDKTALLKASINEKDRGIVTGHDVPGVKPGDVIVCVDRVISVRRRVETLLGDRPKRMRNWAGSGNRTVGDDYIRMVAERSGGREKALTAEISRLRRYYRAES